MNPPDSEIEDLLRALRPRPPRAELEESIGAQIAARTIAVAERLPAAAVLRRGPAAAPARWWQGWGWAFAGAVTAAVIIVGAEHFSSPPAAALATAVPAEPFVTEQLEHVDSTAEIVATEDEGLVLTDNAEPVHRVRFTSYERHIWTNPATGALMEYTVPREDIRLTPIALQ